MKAPSVPPRGDDLTGYGSMVVIKKPPLSPQGGMT